jgi:hypothetical protein
VTNTFTRLATLCLLGLLFIGQVGCTPTSNGPSSPEIVALVDNQVLTKQDIREQLMQTPGVVDTLAFYRSTQKTWVEREMILAHARSIGLDKTTRYQTRQQDLSKQLLEDEFAIYLDQYHSANVDITQEEIKILYTQP